MAAIDDKSLEIQTLAQGLAGRDPRTYEALLAIANQLGQITRVLVPIQKIVGTGESPALDLIPPVEINYQILKAAIRFMWERPPQGGSFTFEIRQGEDWQNANFITRTNGTVVDLRPIPGAPPTYLFKSIDAAGNYSIAYSTITLVYELPSGVSLTGQVIDNNVLLRWTDSISVFDIDYYEILKNSLLIGTIRSNFTTIFEVLAGSYNYEIIPVDIAGNRGPSSRINLSVNQPPDYVLASTVKSNFSGIKTNVLVEFDPSLVGST